MAKTAQLQIRLMPKDKARLKRLASAAGQDMSAYVLSRVFRPERDRFREIVRQLVRGDDHRYAFAELHDFLADLAPIEFRDAVAQPLPDGLSLFLGNYVAAMVEHAAMLKGVQPPSWVRDVAPLEEPAFGAPLKSVRIHLLRSSPVAFKRRNIFVDATVGARV